uniref:Uncharacterized protein n=1 Tax=Setaria viridis TaxID=4556 RepID=A0A4U6VXJ2_SETVI|nr:hypothetical protein SEVIR_2G269250v2 [Setaria viridis]
MLLLGFIHTVVCSSAADYLNGDCSGWFLFGTVYLYADD